MFIVVWYKKNHNQQTMHIRKYLKFDSDQIDLALQVMQNTRGLKNVVIVNNFTLLKIKKSEDRALKKRIQNVVLCSFCSILPNPSKNEVVKPYDKASPNVFFFLLYV